MSATRKLLRILGLFDDRRTSLRVEDAARILEVSPATAYRYFADLTHAALIERGSDGRYVLGPAIVTLDRQIRVHDRLLAASKDIMKSLSERTGGTSLLCRLHSRKVVCVHQVAGRLAPDTVSFERGRAMPLFRGATSRVILAHLDVAALHALAKAEAPALRAAGLPGNSESLAEHLRQARETGVCIAVGEVDRDAMGVASPLHRRSKLLGSLSVVVASTQLESDVRRLADQVRRAAFRIEGRLDSATDGERLKAVNDVNEENDRTALLGK